MTERGQISEEKILDMPLGSLITTVSKVHSVFLYKEIEKLGITGGQFQFLVGLDREEGITQEYLAKKFHMNESTIARALRKLEDAGMILRTVDDNNRRRNIITITKKGKAAADNIRKKEEEWERNISSLSGDEKKELKDMLRAMLMESMQSMDRARD
jgi:DNA-binding MarR family transcriptional regulator